MELTKRDGKWWIEGADPYHIDGDGPYTDYGPYDTKSLAADDLRGLRAFEKLFLLECQEGRQGNASAGQFEAIPASAADADLAPCAA